MLQRKEWATGHGALTEAVGEQPAAEGFGAAFPRPDFSKMGCCSLYALVPVLAVQSAGGMGVLPAPAEVPESIHRVAWTPAVPSSW